MVDNRLMNILGPGKIQSEDVVPNWAANVVTVGNALKSMMSTSPAGSVMRELGMDVPTPSGEEQFMSDLFGVMGATTKSGMNKFAVHGTSLDNLDSILSGGLKRGSALDFTKGNQWASEYEAILSVPKARPGRYIEHNKFYESANKTMPTRVTVDLDVFTDQGADIALRQIDKLKKRFPSVKWTIKGSPPGPDVVNTTNVAALYKRKYNLPHEDALEQAKFDFEVDSIDLYRMDTKKSIFNMKDYEEMLDYYESIGD